ncbi:MAG TPA: HD domain-containing protein [Casimicrobiaceae bacterium]|nr:HD domain-containing protein [Casimicrobiaceae bacterium]
MSSLSDRAQTNVRLYAQLIEARYPADVIVSVREAYRLAVRLFAGQWRAEGRPFVCHLVGVASILAVVGADRATIVAGLLHSAYSHGDFGLGMGRVRRTSRAGVSAIIGDDAERLVNGYAGLHWNPRVVYDWIDDLHPLDGDVRRLVTIRLANALDDALDEGLSLSARAARKEGDVSMDAMATLAHTLGFVQLASALRDVGAGGLTIDSDALRDDHRASYVLGPASWGEKMLPRLARFAARVR